MDGSSLYSLLGLTPDASPAKLRYVYEQAVGAAAARQDWSRAANLSAAFDALPSAVRTRVYPGRERNAARFSEQPPPTPAPPFRARRHRARSTSAQRMSRILLAGLTAVIGLLSVGVILSHRADAPARVSVPHHTLVVRNQYFPGVVVGPVRSTAAAPASTVAWRPMDAIAPGSAETIVPWDAVVDAYGYAAVMCPDGPGGSWQRLTAHPGQHFVCPSGYVGLVLARR